MYQQPHQQRHQLQQQQQQPGIPNWSSEGNTYQLFGAPHLPSRMHTDSGSPFKGTPAQAVAGQFSQNAPLLKAPGSAKAAITNPFVAHALNPFVAQAL